MTESKMIHNSHNVSILVYHFVSSVGKNSNEKVIREYVQQQGKQEEYKQLKIRL